MMKRKYLTYLCLLFVLACKNPSVKVENANKVAEKAPKIVKIVPKNPNYRIIHVFVALCDNVHQGIVKVPEKIGNGKDPENNLYWGTAFGTKTFLKKQTNWNLVQTLTTPKEKIVERCVFKHRSENVFLVADAYDGERIKDCTSHFLKSCSGEFPAYFSLEKDTIACGGNADLLAYIGHNGLMDFSLTDSFPAKNKQKRAAIILACKSQDYFAPFLKQTKAEVLLWTTNFMAPEAYTLAAATDAWVAGKDKNTICEAAAIAYHQYQKCGIKGARNLLVNTWTEDSWGF